MKKLDYRLSVQEFKKWLTVQNLKKWFSFKSIQENVNKEQFQKYFVETLKTNYAEFEGRVGREVYWRFILFVSIIFVLLSLFDLLLKTPFLIVLFVFLMLSPLIGLSVRRLHDIGQSGWLLIIGFVPIIGWMILIALLSMPTVSPEKKTEAVG